VQSINLVKVKLSTKLSLLYMLFNSFSTEKCLYKTIIESVCCAYGFWFKRCNKKACSQGFC